MCDDIKFACFRNPLTKDLCYCWPTLTSRLNTTIEVCYRHYIAFNTLTISSYNGKVILDSFADFVPIHLVGQISGPGSIPIALRFSIAEPLNCSEVNGISFPIHHHLIPFVNL